MKKRDLRAREEAHRGCGGCAGGISSSFSAMLDLKTVSISGGNVEDADGCMNPEPREELGDSDWRTLI